MNFAHCAVVAGCLAIQIFAHSSAVAPRLGPAPHVAVRSVAAQTTQSSTTVAPAAKPQQAYTLPRDKLAKAITLGRIRNILEIVGSVWGLVVLWLLLATRAAAGLESWTQRILRRRWLQGLLFFAIFLIILTVANLPLDIYGHLVGRVYGISVEGWGAWFVDLAKSLGLTLLVGTPALLLFNWIVRRWPRHFWLGCWMAVVPLIVLSTFLEPLVEPLFYHYEPLSKEHPALVAELEKVVARTGTNIPPDRMFLMKASTKTNGLNAYVSGIGPTKQIVVFDTTADRIPDDEILYTFAHESGHYVLNHIPKGIALSAVGLFFVFWGCAGFAAWLVQRCGARWGTESISSRAGFVVLLFVLSIADFLLAPVGNAVSRHFEHQADVYGQEAIHGLVPNPQKTAVAEFNDLGKAWLEDPTPSPIIEFWLYNHPSIQNRANFALQYDPWANGEHGEFFDK